LGGGFTDKKWQTPYDFKKDGIFPVSTFFAAASFFKRLRPEHQFLWFIFSGMDLVSDDRDCPDRFTPVRVRGAASRTKYGAAHCHLSLPGVAVDVCFLVGAFSELTVWSIPKTHSG
jgi:hypothetical protein